MRKFFCLLIALCLSGCASSGRLGISEAQWQAMSPVERQQALENYSKLKSDFSATQTKVSYDGPLLSVYMLRGKAVMPPFTRSYEIETTEFKIAPGACKHIMLRSIDTANYTYLQACYDGERLSLDPSRYELDKGLGTVSFLYNPIWLRGFTYSQIKSSGYVRLEDASVSIKAIPEGLAQKYRNKR